MADEVYAKDVLGKAVEYLSTLGSNIRNRSEILKEKKIRDDKLNNVLAVQKAASLVLLTCEQSKKSLLSVETNVRRALELIDASQASSSNGGETSQTKKDHDSCETKYYYFEYNSRKLKIKKPISFKHYNSVKVYAKMLPKSMMDKYPVHYDCKLYRMRRKKEEELKEAEEPKNKKVRENSTQSVSVSSIPDTPISKSESKSNKNNSDTNPNDNVSITSIPHSPESKVDDSNKTGKLFTKNKSWRKSSVESTKERNASRDGAQSPSKKSDTPEKHRSRGKDCRKETKSLNSEDQMKSSKRKIIISDSSSDTEKNLDVKSEKKDRKKTRSSNSEDQMKSSKRKRIISDSSSDTEKNSSINSEKKENDSASKRDDSDVSRHESNSKNQKLREESKNDSKLLEDRNIAENEASRNADTQDEIIKPVIKCVSLSKLLKSDVVKKEEVKSPHSKPKDGCNKTRQLEKSETVRSDEQSRKDKKEEEYSSAKRKEVASFKPKNFVINVMRLPELSLEYLNKLCLKKITQCGITICEILDENIDETDAGQKDENRSAKSRKIYEKEMGSNESKSNSRRASSNCSNDDDLIEANKVKNSLLKESDSDDVIGSDNESKSLKEKSENIKSTLLNDSDSETKKSDDGIKSNKDNKNDKESDTKPKKGKNTLSASESDKNEPDSSSQIEKDDIALRKTPDSDSEHKETNSENSAAAAETIPKRSDSKDDDLNENDSDSSVKKNDENLSECKRNEKTPEKEKDSRNTDKAKSSLLDGSSDEKTLTPLSQRLTPRSKKKRIRESIQAKKMLLTYSSSDTEDEQLKNALKEIKESLLHGSDDEKKKKRSEDSSLSSSGEDVAKVKPKMHTLKKRNRRRLDSEDRTENSDVSNSSSSKMVRSKSKPGNCSSQNSEAPDSNDKDIYGLTDLQSLKKSRRRNSNSSEISETSDLREEQNTKKNNSKLKTKPTGLKTEEMLKAKSSSESAASSAEENDDLEDFPEMTLPSLNGGGGHLAKEDLLRESDSSGSHNEDATSVKDESGSEKQPSKRRKAIAISSDSEVGSSRKKDADVKLSDFEDSEDSDINKRSKRKKKVTDSDASVGTTSSNEGGKKKRRRIKSVRDSDGSGSDSENEGRNKHGRKNIRKVMGKNQLEEATKKAAREEKERIARIADRQKMYNNMQFDESGKPDEVVLDKVVLDFDPETKEPLIEVDRGLVKKLKPHQANGIKFMWDACFESVKRIKKDRGSGCILAHCMGLGKTLQVVSLTHTLLIHSALTSVSRVLVVCPLSTVLNWVNEFRMWLKYAENDYEVEVYELSRHKQNSERSFQLSQWIRHGGVCVLGYEMFRNLSQDNSKKFKKKMLKNFQEALVDPGPDMVVCDEGHLLKNEKTSLSQSMNRVKTYRRIVLTGTPLQNNLKEYYCMVQFVKPNLLGKYNEYLNRFVNPITNGQYTDSTEHDIKIMKRRSHVLHKMLDGAVQRRDYGVLAPFLPPKHEYVLFITLAEVQTKLYQHYLDNFSRKPLPGKSSGFLFPDFQSLQRIWTHPLVLKYNSERYEIMQQKKRDKEEEDSEGSIRDFIDDDSTSEESTADEITDDSSEASDDSRKKGKKKKKSAKKSKGKDKDKDKEVKSDAGQSKPRRGTRANPIDLDDEEEVEDLSSPKYENPTEWWVRLVEEEELDDMRNSHKLVLLFDILRQCEAIGDKLLVFSQSLYSLDLIEHFLGKVDDATQEGRVDDKLGGHIGTWSPGVDYFRLDGSTSCENRSIWCKNFNREDNPRARLFLISTRAGGLGINLVAANRVVIFDVSWNPSHDVQSIFRVYRFGQKKPCYVYRFLAMGTMEEKIYERQVTKQAISKRVIDEQQIDRHYAENDLAELYNFEPKPPSPRPIPPLPKDRLFAEMLREHEVQIYKYHEHDSLLENKEEETLSEEERKAAWEDFENEKNRPPPAAFPNTWQMPNLMQQQQLAYAALASMLRKDMPNLNDNQLRDMLPLIYNSNPQLMQKLSEIYKYSPGMMNPAMMNPGVMNPAAGVGGMGGMGGASGLQYEPPWQRQQQQQQQIRLQQLLQHQNQMGAKFYAGGLGSRDPVAMALQQQRAREIMLSGGGAGAGAGAGRPRGRPPMQPRAPPAGDVVNLDSD